MEDFKNNLDSNAPHDNSHDNTRPNINTLRQTLDELLEQQTRYEITICHLNAIMSEGVITDAALLEGMKQQIELLRPQLQEVECRIQECERLLGILDSATANFDPVR